MWAHFFPQRWLRRCARGGVSNLKVGVKVEREPKPLRRRGGLVLPSPQRQGHAPSTENFEFFIVFGGFWGTNLIILLYNHTEKILQTHWIDHACAEDKQTTLLENIWTGIDVKLRQPGNGRAIFIKIKWGLSTNSRTSWSQDRRLCL